MSEYKVLIAEDEASLAEALKTKLESEGMTVNIATDGVEALEKLGSSKFDILLLDLLMPNKDGVAVLQELQSMPKHKPEKIFVLSNLNKEAKQVDFDALGVNDFIVKADSSLKEIAEHIKSALN